MAFDFDAFDASYFNEKAEPPPADVPEERSWGEALSDVGAAAGAGAGSLVSGIGSLAGVVTGDMDNGSALREIGDRTSEYWGEKQSDYIKAKKDRRKDAVAQAGDQWGKLGTYLWETVQEPALLMDFAAEQVPMFVPGGAAGRLVGAGARTLGAGETLAKGAATAAAVGVGTGQQAGDVAGSTYERLMELDERTWASNKDYQRYLAEGATTAEAKEQAAQGLVEAATAAGTLVSLGTNLLPGARAIEKALAGGKPLTGNVIKRVLTGAAGEGLQEAAEESSGQLAGNLAVRQVDPTQAKYEGVGEAAGAGLLSAGFGAVSGLRKGDAPPPPGGDADKDVSALVGAVDASAGNQSAPVQPQPAVGAIPALGTGAYEHVGPFGVGPKGQPIGTFRDTATGEEVQAMYSLFQGPPGFEAPGTETKSAIKFDNEGLPPADVGAMAQDPNIELGPEQPAMQARRDLQDLIAASETARDPATVAALKERVRPHLAGAPNTVDHRAATQLFNDLAAKEANLGAAAAADTVAMGEMARQRQAQEADKLAQVEQAFAQRQAQQEQQKARESAIAAGQRGAQQAAEQWAISETQEPPANTAMGDALRVAQEEAARRQAAQEVASDRRAVVDAGYAAQEADTAAQVEQGMAELEVRRNASDASRRAAQEPFNPAMAEAMLAARTRAAPAASPETAPNAAADRAQGIAGARPAPDVAQELPAMQEQADALPRRGDRASFADDMSSQLAWLNARAQAVGFANVDEMLASDMAQFQELARQWRDENPMPRQAPSTVEGVREELSQEIGGFRVNEAQKSGLIRIVKNAAEVTSEAVRNAIGADADVAAVWDGQSMWLLADNIAPGESVPKMLHEAKHGGTDIWGEMDDVQAEFDRLLAEGDAAALSAQARAEADPATAGNAKLLQDERLGYFTEEARARMAEGSPVKLSERARALYQKIIAALKARIRTSPFMQAMGGRFIDFKLTDEYAVALAHQALRALEKRVVGSHGEAVAQQEVPVAQQEVPVAQQEVPAAQQEVPAAQQEVPAAQQEAPAAQQEVPAAQQEDVDGYAVAAGSIAPRYSLSTWNAESQEKLRAANERNGLVAREDLDKWIEDIDSMAAKVLANKDLHFNANLLYDPFKPNSDPHYKFSLDFSTLCKKRLVLQATLEDIQLKLDRGLTATEFMQVRSRLKAEGYTVSCGVCYVDTRRMHMGKAIEEFLGKGIAEIAKMSKSVDYEAAAASKITAKMATDPARQDEFKEKFPDAYKVWSSYTRKLKKKPGGTPAAADLKRAFAEFKQLKTPGAMKRRAGLADAREAFDTIHKVPKHLFLSQEGLDRMKADYNDAYRVFMGYLNPQAMKTPESRTEYTNQILEHYTDRRGRVRQAAVDAVNAKSGQRWQSWSDFELVHALDAMQAIADMAVVGLHGHTYTKVPEMPRVLGDTGLMINLSLIPRGKGLRSDGSLDFDPVEGMPFDVARQLRARYGQTTGTIAIGISDEHIRALLAHPDIDYVIPYHASGLSRENMARMEEGMEGWTDYAQVAGMPGNSNDSQKEVVLDKTKAAAAGAQVKGGMVEWGPLEIENWWDNNKTGEENAAEYLRLVREAGLRPKFPMFVNADYTEAEPGYWKLLVDRRMYDNEGIGIVQGPVRPEFDMDAVQDLLANYSKEDYSAPQAIVTDLADQIERGESGGVQVAMPAIRKSRGSQAGGPATEATRPDRKVRRSRTAPSSIDSEYEDAVARGDADVAEQMVVDKAAQEGLELLADTPAYTVRRGASPRRTETAYKLFKMKPSQPGKLFPLFVEAGNAIPTGVWLDARAGREGPPSKTGVRRVKSKLGDLSYRPGWHAGDVPLATHIGAKGKDGRIWARKDDEVWVEVEVAADDGGRYQAMANENGRRGDGTVSAAKADIKEMPVDGMYRYKTNPNMTGEWIISGSMKINRVLTEDEVNALVQEAGLEPMPWEGGPSDSRRYGVEPGDTVASGKVPGVTYDDNGDLIPLSQRMDPANPDIRFSRGPGPAGRAVQAAGRTLGGTPVGAAAANAVQNTLAKLKLVDTAPPQLKKLMRQYRTQVNKSKASAKTVAEEGAVLSDAEKAMLSDVLEGTLQTGQVPPAYVQRLGVSIRNALDVQTDELLRLGMITQESADRWRDVYLPRFYRKHMNDSAMKRMAEAFRFNSQRAGIRGKHLKGRGIWEPVPESEVQDWTDMGWEERGQVATSKRNQLAGDTEAEPWFYMWRDYTKAERTKMGEIRDGVFRYAAGYLSTQRDIALGRLFEAISQDDEMATSNEAEAGEGWVKLADTKIPDTPGVRKYGKLADMWVHPDVAEQLEHMAGGDSKAWRTYKRWMAAWKEGKTAMNPAAHMNNVMSNIWAAHFGGVAPWRVGLYAKTAKEFKNEGSYYQEAIDNGLLGTEFVSAELAEVFGDYDFGPSPANRDDTVMERLLTRAGELASKAPGWKVYREAARKAYTAEDQYFKLLLYINEREQGATEDEAIEHAERYVFNYADLPKGARAARDSVLPFFSYTYKATGMMLHTLANNPSRLLAPAAFFGGINALAYLMLGADEDDEREVMPEYMRGYTALGTPKNIRLPGGDEGQAQFLDIYRWLPLGDVFDMANQAGGLPIPAPIVPNHPLATLFAGAILNTDPYFGREIVQEWQKDADGDWTSDGYAEFGRWAMQQFLPAAPIIPGSYRFNQLMEGLANELDTEIGPYTGTKRNGEPYSLGQALSHTVGIKTREYDVENERGKRLRSLGYQAREVKSEARKARRDSARGAVTEARVEDRLRRLEERLSRINERAEALTD